MEQRASIGTISNKRFPDGFRIMQGRQEYVTYIEHASLRVWYSDTPWHYECHHHSAVEIIVPLKGEVVYTLPERTYRVQMGEVLIVPPNMDHDLDMREGSIRYLLLFEPTAIFGMRDLQPLENQLKMPLYLSGQTELQKTVRSILMQTVECYDRRDPFWNTLCYAYLLQMYVEIAKHYAVLGFGGDTEPRRMDPEIVDSARLYIEQNYMLDITLNDVAAFSGFSKYYFSRMFKQQMGISFADYLRNKRIEIAEERLIHTRQSIKDIAVAAGFGSIATFNRVFKESKNCTPSRYRRIYGEA